MAWDDKLHPFLMHSRWPQPAVFAHRGFSARLPENTMSAFAAAIALGCEYLETDVHATKDGHLVIFHDDTLERMTGQTGTIEEMNLSELRELRVTGNEPIPLLTELLSEFPDARINIDPKQDSAVQPLLALIADARAWDRVCVGSFSGTRLNHMRSEAGIRLCTAAAPSEVRRLYLARFGLPAGTIAANCLQIPPRKYRIRLVDQAFIQAAHCRQLPVHIWTINDLDDMKNLLGYGVDGIMTDEVETAMNLFQDCIWQSNVCGSGFEGE
ncbi:MAG: glycerophosphodiester phosphodiesterase [Aestuariivita sp.]|nr:glycerophosphodiester phosphodiesterase [Aestuariivita sp.]MCY4202421.1 glycerophosphodiester phosphodiesterase [Aestuariivita sp.]